MYLPHVFLIATEYVEQNSNFFSFLLISNLFILIISETQTENQFIIKHKIIPANVFAAIVVTH